jgi:hypothetical protein
VPCVPCAAVQSDDECTNDTHDIVVVCVERILIPESRQLYSCASLPLGLPIKILSLLINILSIQWSQSFQLCSHWIPINTFSYLTGTAVTTDRRERVAAGYELRDEV